MRSPVRIWIAAPFKSPWPMARGFSRFLASPPAVTDFAVFKKPLSFGCLRIRNHCPPTDDFAQLLCQSSLPASKDACAAFPFTSPKSPGGGCVAVLAQRFVPRVPWKGCVEYWMYFQALYRVLWGKSLSQNQCFLIWRQPWSEVRFLLRFFPKQRPQKAPVPLCTKGNGGLLHLHLTTGYRSARYSRH